MTKNIPYKILSDKDILVSFALIAYNQEKYIFEAVEAALAQTYTPLEIIISDDCSTDKTFEIVEQLCQNYSGHHKIILNRNEVNLGSGGLAAHVNKVMSLCSGRFIVMAAGDDISIPTRTSTLVNYWLNNKYLAICSGFEIINDLGCLQDGGSAWFEKSKTKKDKSRFENLKSLIEIGVPALIGCTESWDLRLLTQSGKLPENVFFEDKVMSFRALLLEDIAYVNEKLVYYRVHGESISNYLTGVGINWREIIDEENSRSRKISRDLNLAASQKIDLINLNRPDLLTKAEFEELILILDLRSCKLLLLRDWWSLCFFEKLKSNLRINTIKTASDIFKFLPLSYYAFIKSFFRKIK